jgi:hypothetical protein
LWINGGALVAVVGLLQASGNSLNLGLSDLKHGLEGASAVTLSRSFQYLGHRHAYFVGGLFFSDGGSASERLTPLLIPIQAGLKVVPKQPRV